MRTLSRTREDLLADPELSAVLGDLSDWRPAVQWVPHAGVFCMEHVAIYFCPWCGSQLPDNSDEALSKVQKTGIYISVDPKGEIHAEVAGKFVDTAEPLAKLAAATKDQG
jgi:hypothetical protein